MTITRWSNEIQRAVIEEWTEGCQEAEGPQALRVLRKQIAGKYGLNAHIIQAIIELGATEGLSRVKSEANLTDGHSWEPINYHELSGDLKERTKNLERKFEYLLDGIEKVLTDGDTMAIHLGNLRQMGKWMKKRDILDEKETPPLLEIQSQNTTGDRESTPNELSPIEKIGKVRTQADNAFKRGRLLFKEVEETEEGKKASPR